MRVLSYGEILWDIIEGNPYIGGAPFNFAAHISRCGAETYMISRVGKDDFGDKALQKVEELGVHTHYLQRDEKYPTGTVDVFLKNGQPSYTINTEVAYDYIDLEQLKDNGLFSQNFDVFGFGTLAQRNTTSQQSLEGIMNNMSFKQVFYDVNLRKDCFSAEIVRQSLNHSTLFKLNDEEVPIVSQFVYGKALGMEDFCRNISSDSQQEIIIVTAGGEGCYVYHAGSLHHVPGKKVTVVDTVGAGDSFSAAFIAMYLKKGDPVQAASIANQVGGFVASSHGPIPPYSAEIKSLLDL